MPRKRFTVEQIINHLREAEVLLAQGQRVGELCRRIGITEQTFLPVAPRVWRPEAGPGEASEGARAGECPAQACGCRSDAGQVDPEGSC